MISLRRVRTGALLVLLLFVALLGAGMWRTPAAEGRVLEVELQTSAGTAAQIFWDQAPGFSEERSLRAPLERTPGGYQIVRLALPNRKIQALRFDPSNEPAEIWIRRMVVRDASGTQVAELNPGSLFPLHGVASVVREGTVTRITTPPAGSDPAFLVSVACLDGRAAWYDVTSVTPLSLAGAVFLMFALLGASAWAVIRDLLERDLPVAERDHARIWRGILWIAVVFGLALSAKLYLLREYPSPVPFLDQWNAETNLYVGFNEGCLSWTEMVALHNEHRILFARLLALALFVGNAQWDPQLQQVVNALAHAATGVLLAVMVYVTSERRRLDLAVLASVLTFAAPFAWENIVFGFQSAFYLLVLFSILALWLTLRYPPGTFPWALGWICAGASMFTAASGLVTVAVALLATSARVRWCGHPRRHILANLVPAAPLLVIGVSTMAAPLERHASYRAATLLDWAIAFGRNVAWPWVDEPWRLPVLWAPLVVLMAIRLARRHKEAADREWWMYGLAVWTVVNAALLAYARGAGGLPPSSRYMDFLSLGAIVNFGAVASLIGLMPRSAPKRSVAAVALAVWAITLCLGVDRVTRRGFIDLRAVNTWLVRYTENLRRFIATDDLEILASKTFPTDVPFTDPILLANAWLRHPYIREMLPPEIRQPLALEPARITDEGFVQDGVYPTTPTDPLRPAWGSFTERQNPSQGTFESTAIGDCRRPFLRFDIAGYLKSRGLSLGTQDLGTARTTPLVPSDLARETWVTTFARCGGPFKVVANDANPNLWFAFRNPIEYGFGSWLAKELVDHSRGLLFGFAALALVALRVMSSASAPQARSAAP